MGEPCPGDSGAQPLLPGGGAGADFLPPHALLRSPVSCPPPPMLIARLPLDGFAPHHGPSPQSGALDCPLPPSPCTKPCPSQECIRLAFLSALPTPGTPRLAVGCTAGAVGHVGLGAEVGGGALVCTLLATQDGCKSPRDGCRLGEGRTAPLHLVSTDQPGWLGQTLKAGAGVGLGEGELDCPSCRRGIAGSCCSSLCASCCGGSDGKARCGEWRGWGGLVPAVGKALSRCKALAVALQGAVLGLGACAIGMPCLQGF